MLCSGRIGLSREIQVALAKHVEERTRGGGAIRLAQVGTKIQARQAFGVMHLAKGDTRIDCSGRALQREQNTPPRADQSEKPVERHIMTMESARIGASHLADKQLQEFWSGPAQRQQ